MYNFWHTNSFLFASSQHDFIFVLGDEGSWQWGADHFSSCFLRIPISNYILVVILSKELLKAKIQNALLILQKLPNHIRTRRKFAKYHITLTHQPTPVKCTWFLTIWGYKTCLLKNHSFLKLRTITTYTYVPVNCSIKNSKSEPVKSREFSFLWKNMCRNSPKLNKVIQVNIWKAVKVKGSIMGKVLEARAEYECKCQVHSLFYIHKYLDLLRV